ncbi:PilZ domain-containing protein [Sphingomonas sp. 37zxx]|uniref:PilZ domain-containing protein n=1 Tax=Sphingomonas sp. 37zxx TaxID=1550073 RepID=UPI00068CB0CA|nr:PilZ domain-containing protein [Sphingomonas sp. 37zxx]
MAAASPTREDTALKSRDARLTTIFLVGRLSDGMRDDLCRIRNISTGGMRIETLAPVDRGQPICVELKNGVTVRSEVVWTKDGSAGVRFIAPVDIAQVLAPPAKAPRVRNGVVPRAPRLTADCPVVVRHEGHIAAAVLVDVSQGGARVRANGTLGVGDCVVLCIPMLGSRRALVRWVSDDMVGLAFAEKLGFAELAQWLARPERFARGRASLVNLPRQNS